MKTATRPGVMFGGGGKDVDAAFQWMCGKAKGGDFLVLRATGTAAYNPYVYGLCPGINSVATLQISSRAGAMDPFVESTILHAEALFIAGGSQDNYVNYWQGTPVNRAIDQLAVNGVAIGGSSAGNAILAQFAFSALNDTVKSGQALANPYSPLVTIDDGFLHVSSLLANMITDDHFAARDRMGRLIAFLARIVQDKSVRQASAIATDEKTAYLLEANGAGSVVGTGSAYFVRTRGKPEVCTTQTPLTYKNVSVYRVAAGGTFNVSTWTGTNGTAYSLSALDGVLRSTQKSGEVY